MWIAGPAKTRLLVRAKNVPIRSQSTRWLQAGPGGSKRTLFLQKLLPNINIPHSHATCPVTFFSRQEAIAELVVHKGLVPGWEEGSVSDELAAALLFHYLDGSVDVVCHTAPRTRAPAASRIALLDNFAELYLAREEGARRFLDSASRPTLAIDAREWFDPYNHNDNELARIVGVKAKHFTSQLRQPSELWPYLDIALDALRHGERVIIFCREGRHRSFQLLCYLLSAYMRDFRTTVDFITTKRPIVQATYLPRLWPVQRGWCLSKFGFATFCSPDA